MGDKKAYNGPGR